MEVNMESTEGLTPKRMLTELRLFKTEKEKSKPAVLGQFGFSDIFELEWWDEPFEAFLTQPDKETPMKIELPHLWLQKVLAGARMTEEEAEEVIKGKFVCAFKRMSETDEPELIFLSPLTEDLESWVDSESLADKKSMEMASALSSMKPNAWF